MHIHNPLAGSGGSAGTNRSFDVASYKVKTMAEVAQTPNTFAYVFTRRGTRKPMLVRTCYFGDRTDDIAKWVGKTAFTPTKKKDASPLFLPPSIKRQCEGGADLAASIHNAVLARRRGLLPPPTSPTSPPPPSPKSPSSALLDELNRDDLPLNDEEKRELVEQAADALEFGEPEAAIVGEDFTYGDEQPTDDDLTDVEAAGLAAAIGDNGGGFDESLFLDSVSYSQEAGADEVDPATLAALEPIEDDEMTSPWALAVERLRAERAATNGGPVEELDEIALAELAERQAQAVVEGEPGAADDFDGAPESSDEAAIDAAAQEAEREQALLALALADTPPGVAALQSRLQRARRGGMELGLQG